MKTENTAKACRDDDTLPGRLFVSTINAAALKKLRNKWVSLLLCLFLGYVGAHKFYEGKIGMGVLYLVTGGLFLIGVIVDLISIIFKPNPYYV